MTTLATDPAIDPATVPGGMERTIARVLPDGALIEFEEAPAGYLTKKGEPRQAPWRAYFYTAPGEKRTRLVSTTTLLDTICPKDGLPPWAEARGIEGAITAMRAGEIKDDTDPERAVEVVRTLKLGAEASKQKAADRGLNVHALLEDYLRTGTPPALGSHPVEHHGYITALSGWLLSRNPEPIAIEQLVVHPEDGYAGRLDLRARVAGRLLTIDAKTQERAGIYRGAHLQVGLYERAAVRCGDEPADGRVVVVFAADGQWREMPADHEDWKLDAALLFHRACKPIDSLCESLNRQERQARA